MFTRGQTTLTSDWLHGGLFAQLLQIASGVPFGHVHQCREGSPATEDEPCRSSNAEGVNNNSNSNPLKRLEETYRSYREYFSAEDDEELKNSWTWMILTSSVQFLLSILSVTLIYYVFLLLKEN